MLGSAAVKRRLPILLVMFAAFGCGDVPSETVNRCLPEGADCSTFTGAAVRIEPDLKRGDRVYKQYCRKCHGGMGVAVGFPARGDFRDPAWHERFSDTNLAEIITAGRGMAMPGVRLTPLDRASVIAFVRNFNKNRGVRDANIEAPEGQGPVMK